MITMWEMEKAEMEQNIIIISKMGQINKQPRYSRGRGLNLSFNSLL